MRTFDRRHLESFDHLLMWIHAAPGAFSAWDLAPGFEEREILIGKLEALVQMGTLERFGDKRGWYVKAESSLVEIDYKNASTNDSVDIWLPFGLSDLVEIHPGNVIIFAGIPNAGKSALIYNAIKENRHKGWDQHLFNSESGAGELRKRLDKFPDMSIEMWNFKAYQRSENFHQVIKPGLNSINYIDFLEVHSDFYAIGGLIKQIHDKLDGAIAIIGLQKNPGSETGLGGYRMLEVTRLAIALEFGKVKIIKAKNFRDPENNPNGQYRNFKLVNGYNIISNGGWYREENGK